jgi:hypothetical protein
MDVTSAVMKVNGCGNRSVELTFYLLPRQPMSMYRALPLACGQRAESRGGRGVLLCADCAERHGLKQGNFQYPYPTGWSLV